MPRMVFINLPVADLARSMAFYEALGFTNNPQFTNEKAAAMVWSESIYVMLLTHDFWKTFTTKTIPDGKTNAQVMLALNLDDRAAVDAMIETAAAHGGVPDCNPKQDYDFMYGRDFEDPDGHIWEPHWLDPQAMQNNATDK